MLALLGLAGAGPVAAQVSVATDTVTRAPVVISITLRGRHYEELRGAELRVFGVPDGGVGELESRRVADISPGSRACGGAEGERTCFVAASASPGRARVVVELVPAPPVGDSFPDVYPRPVAEETFTVAAGRTDTVRFEWRAPTLPEVWRELLGFAHLGFGLPLAVAFTAVAAWALRRPVRRGGRWLIGAGALLAVLVPWLTGAAVKLWLQAHAQPTLPWGMFLNLRGLPQMVMLGALFGAPLCWTAWLADRILRRGADPARRRQWESATLGALAATVGAVTLSSVTMFWAFEPMAFFIAPSFWLAWLPVAVVGAGVGWAVGGSGMRMRKSAAA